MHYQKNFKEDFIKSSIKKYFLSKRMYYYNKFFLQTRLYWLLKSSASFTELFFYFKKKKSKKEKITNKTELLIDGPTRSGNHFAVHYVKRFNDITLARHYHSPGAIRLAFKKKVPTLLLVRDPVEQIASAYVYLEKNVPLKRIIKSYQIFYERCLLAKNWYVVACFDEIINNPDNIIKKINNKYDLNLQSEPLSPSLNEAILNDIKESNQNQNEFSMFNINLEMKMAAPNKNRDIFKNDVKNKLKKDFATEIKICNDIYEKMKA